MFKLNLPSVIKLFAEITDILSLKAFSIFIFVNPAPLPINEVALIFPITSNFSSGNDVPIPTSPLLVTLNLSTWSVPV